MRVWVSTFRKTNFKLRITLKRFRLDQSICSRLSIFNSVPYKVHISLQLRFESIQHGKSALDRNCAR